jgi:hypothetical protein
MSLPRCRSTIPVANGVERIGLARANAVSSTPTAATPSMRPGCSINTVPYSTTAAITAAQPTPKSRATAATECPSRPTRRHACFRARSLHDVRALICRWLSVQVCCSHSRWMQRQMRLTHTNVTARSPAGRSRTQVGRRLCNRACAPQVGHQPTLAVVSIAYSTSRSPSETANTAMPARPSIAVALLFSITWGLPVRVP